MPTNTRSRRQRLIVALIAGALALGACSTADAGATDAVTSSVESASPTQVDESSSVFDSSMIHALAIDVAPDDYESAIASYLATGDKEWIEATVTIDGVTYEQVGLRLKGNSSLRGIGAETAPETLPWLIRLDKYVDGQNHEGYADLVIRSNSSASALNESVALDLLEAAGLASQQAVYTSLSVNGSDDVLRLMIEHPDDVWMASTIDADGALYKAESTGDYSYRGDDPEAYDEVFDQEAGDDNADLAPLIEFLDFINNADDATFEAELADRLDVEAFADYLAMMDLVDNFDDIDGPGNNSYLYYDPDTEVFTVVPWDLNLAFGASPAGGGGPGDRQPGDLAEAGARPERPTDAEAVGPGSVPEAGGPGGSNVLAERFRSIDSFASLREEALTELRSELFDSGAASDLLDARVAVLTGADQLIEASTLATEASVIDAAVS